MCTRLPATWTSVIGEELLTQDPAYIQALGTIYETLCSDLAFIRALACIRALTSIRTNTVDTYTQYCDTEA